MKKTLCTALAAFSLGIFSGCSNETSAPVTTNSDTKTPVFMKLPERLDKSVSKLVTATKFITRAQGGTLALRTQYKAAPDSHLVTIDITLRVRAGDLPYDASLTMTLDDVLFLTDINLTFGPHGIVFANPAKLEVEATGLRFAGSTDRMALYYVSGGVWQRMPNSEVDYYNGELEAEGSLPHFSQYAFGRVTD